jgi:hypothetical protein
MAFWASRSRDGVRAASMLGCILATVSHAPHSMIELYPFLV